MNYSRANSRIKIKFGYGLNIMRHESKYAFLQWKLFFRMTVWISHRKSANDVWTLWATAHPSKSSEQSISLRSYELGPRQEAANGRGNGENYVASIHISFGTLLSSSEHTDHSAHSYLCWATFPTTRLWVLVCATISIWTTLHTRRLD